MEIWWKIAADCVLLIHVSYVSFVVLGLLLIVVGGFRRWKVVRNFWFRSAHLAAIGIVVFESWMNITCPLTNWENMLRQRAGMTTYQGDFIAIWLHRILFFDLPESAFIAAYSLFGATTLLVCILIPPRRPWSTASSGKS